MKIFAKDMTIVNGFSKIVFICGSHFSKTDITDKRTVLKTFINKQYGDSVKVIILEENFLLSKSSKTNLGYDSIFLNSLGMIEKMVALYSDKVIVIHESISTATELGIFSIDPSVALRTCMIVPDEKSQEENKVSFFMREAFKALPNNPHAIKEIRFYPDTKRSNISPNRTEYYTYFHNNEIGSTLREQITSFLNFDTDASPAVVKISQSNYKQPPASVSIISYRIIPREDTGKGNSDERIEISINAKALQVLLMSIIALYINDKDLKKEKRIKQHVDYFEDKLNLHMIDSVKHYLGQDINTKSIVWEVRGTDCTIREAIGLFLYILQAMSYISMEVPTDSQDYEIRRIVIKEGFKALKESLCDNFIPLETTEFGSVFNEFKQ